MLSVVESVLDSLEKELDGEDFVLSFGTSVETGKKDAASIVDKTASVGRILCCCWAERCECETGRG